MFGWVHPAVERHQCDSKGIKRSAVDSAGAKGLPHGSSHDQLQSQGHTLELGLTLPVVDAFMTLSSSLLALLCDTPQLSLIPSVMHAFMNGSLSLLVLLCDRPQLSLKLSVVPHVFKLT
eukprot:1159602-Pelagomonas_calceolata.AAC.5